MIPNAMPILYGASKSSPPKMLPAKGVTMSGDMNCPRYRADESRGITVDAASLPALIDAMVLR